MSDEQSPKKHHYIPAFYTKRWAGSDGCVTELTRPHKRISIRRAHPNATGYVDRLYELRGFPENLAQAIEERFLRPVDNLAADALDVLHTPDWRELLSDRRRSAWSRFIISLLMRCPEDIAPMRQYWNLVFEESDPESEEHYLSIRSERDPPSLREYIAAAPIAERERGFHKTFLELVDNLEVGAFLNEMPAVVIDTSSCGIDLLTSDRPVILTNGLRHREGHLALPIGPNRMFLSAYDKPFIDTILRGGIEQMVRASNRAVVRGAKRFVFAKNEDDVLFVARNMSSDQQPRLIENMFRDYLASRQTD